MTQSVHSINSPTSIGGIPKMNSQIIEDQENKWSEEALNKLSCKVLKKLAKSRNINSNIKKAELVQALKHVTLPTEIENTNVGQENVRRTRSRASMFPKNCNNIQESTQDSRNSIDDENTATATTTAKSKGKKYSKEDEDVKLESRLSQQFQLVSSIQPLEEITNNQDSTTSHGEKKNNTRKGRKTKLPSTGMTETETVFSSDKPKDTNIQDLITDTMNKAKIEAPQDEESSIQKPEKGVKKGKRKQEETLEKYSKESRISINKSKDTSIQELKTDSINTKNELDELIKAPQEESRVQMEEPPAQLPEKGVKRGKRKQKNETMKEINDTVSKQDETLKKGSKETTSIKESSNRNKTVNNDKNVHIQEEISAKAIDPTQIDSDASHHNEQTEKLNSSDKIKGTKKKKISKSEEVSTISTEHPESSNESDMPVPVPVRGSTFVLDSSGPDDKGGETGPKNTAKFEKPTRSNTFVLDDNDSGEQSPRRSLRFFPSEVSQKKNTPNNMTSKTGKFIGKRILSLTKDQSAFKSGNKTTAGSTVKKTIVKNTATPGSTLRKTGSSVKKAPNFKAIHQRLFGNMESLGENQKRKHERAQALLLSPAPRCASSMMSPKTSLQNKLSSPRPLTPVSTTSSGHYRSAVSKPIKPETTAVNRFGFKPRVTKTEANTIAGKKLPPVNMEKKKQQDRKFLQGVRTNKRFMLQMKVRMGQSTK